MKCPHGSRAHRGRLGCDSAPLRALRWCKRMRRCDDERCEAVRVKDAVKVTCEVACRVG